MGVTNVSLVGQTGWGICTKCAGVYCRDGGGINKCPAGGIHSTPLTYLCLLTSAQVDKGLPLQSGWRWCRKCQCLFFGLNATKGVCASGGAHDPTGSGNYLLAHQVAFLTNAVIAGFNIDGFRWCKKCEQMGYKQVTGKCAKGGLHDYSGSGAYSITPWGAI